MSVSRYAAAALFAGLAACSDNGPTAGDLSVQLASPNTGLERAILVSVKGRVTDVTAPAGAAYGIAFHLFAGDSARVTVIAPAGQFLAAGGLVRIRVNDVGKAASFSARVLDVIAADYVPLDTTGYVLSVIKP
jgi:hypothetical protein